MQKLLTLTILSMGVIAACAPIPTKSSGEDLYAEFCMSCHGIAGEGNGPMAQSLARAPSDLTTLSAQNGGTFPLRDVLSTIDGYTRAQHGDLTMPEFGVMLEDQPMVLVDTGDGIETPTPEPMLAIAEYLMTLQK